MRRVADQRELMDGPLDGATLKENLRDLARVNHGLGGAELSQRALTRLMRSRPADPVRLLDVGTGAADIPEYLIGWFNERGLRLEVVGVDDRPEMLDVAQDRTKDVPGLRFEVTPSDRLDHPDGSFDVVHASLVLHHLEPPAAERMLGEMARCSSVGIIVNDLDRRPIYWLGASLLSRIATRNRYTRHDAPLSVRRAYRPDEVARLAARAGLKEVARFRGHLGHRYALCFVHSRSRDG